MVSLNGGATNMGHVPGEGLNEIADDTQALTYPNGGATDMGLDAGRGRVAVPGSPLGGGTHVGLAAGGGQVPGVIPAYAPTGLAASSSPSVQLGAAGGHM